jgi:nucleoside-diphosphate-sugar epimerase
MTDRKILVTGSQGYIGTELVRKLDNLGIQVTGIDAGFFQNSKIGDLSEPMSIRNDLRDQRTLNLRGFDTVIHLAALSNDPLGEIDKELTFSINRDSAISLALKAKKQGVRIFIFVSTQSIYGISDSSRELTEESTKNPITAYAKSKWEAEQEILGMSTEDFISIAVRPSTVFGWGSRIRNDIIFNNMISSGIRKGKIEVHTDGTPHRPVVHISDVIDFLMLLLNAPKNIIRGEAYNLGRLNGNYTVREIAEAASRCLGDIPIEFNTEMLNDQRSYRVSFLKAKKDLGFVASKDLEFGGAEILDKFHNLKYLDRERYFSDTTRLNTLKRLIELDKLRSDLSWI